MLLLRRKAALAYHTSQLKQSTETQVSNTFQCDIFMYMNVINWKLYPTLTGGWPSKISNR